MRDLAAQPPHAKRPGEKRTKRNEDSLQSVTPAQKLSPTQQWKSFLPLDWKDADIHCKQKDGWAQPRSRAETKVEAVFSASRAEAEPEDPPSWTRSSAPGQHSCFAKWANGRAFVGANWRKWSSFRCRGYLPQELGTNLLGVKCIPETFSSQISLQELMECPRVEKPSRGPSATADCFACFVTALQKEVGGGPRRGL